MPPRRRKAARANTTLSSGGRKHQATNEPRPTSWGSAVRAPRPLRSDRKVVERGGFVFAGRPGVVCPLRASMVPRDDGNHRRTCWRHPPPTGALL